MKGLQSKYHNKKTTVDGITFDSRREADRYCELKLLLMAGLISDLKLQVPFELVPKSSKGRAIKYIADFVYTDNKTGETVIEDVKGIKTAVYKLKKRLMAEKGLKIHEI